MEQSLITTNEKTILPKMVEKRIAEVEQIIELLKPWDDREYNSCLAMTVFFTLIATITSFFVLDIGIGILTLATFTGVLSLIAHKVGKKLTQLEEDKYLLESLNECELRSYTNLLPAQTHTTKESKCPKS